MLGLNDKIEEITTEKIEALFKKVNKFKYVRRFQRGGAATG